jgi:hypothetical protein
VICPRCSYYFPVEVTGRRQQADCPQCSAFAGAPDREGGLVVKLVCRRCAVGYAVDVAAPRPSLVCSVCGAAPKVRDREMLAKVAAVWRLRLCEKREVERPDPTPLVNLDEMDLAPGLARRVPKSLALAYGCVPIRFENDILTVVMADQIQRGVLEDLAFVLRCVVQGAAAPRLAVERALERCYGSTGGELHA